MCNGAPDIDMDHYTTRLKIDEARSRAPVGGSNLALAIAEELACDFSILNHDGNLTAGEHYWVGLDELTQYIQDCIQRNSND